MGKSYHRMEGPSWSTFIGTRGELVVGGPEVAERLDQPGPGQGDSSIKLAPREDEGGRGVQDARLSGSVQRVIQKVAHRGESLLREIRELVAPSLRGPRSAGRRP